jgi:hypothetical protein
MSIHDSQALAPGFAMRSLRLAVVLLAAPALTLPVPALAQVRQPLLLPVFSPASVLPALQPTWPSVAIRAADPASLDIPPVTPAHGEHRKSGWLLGAVIGAAAGAAGGLLIESAACAGTGERPACVAHGYLYFGLVGAGLGGIIGAAVGAS